MLHETSGKPDVQSRLLVSETTPKWRGIIFSPADITACLTCHHRLFALQLQKAALLLPRYLAVKTD